MKLRVLDLFSGIGGFSLGLERTGGFETVAFCEIEEFPRRVLAKHWPGVPIFEDVRELRGEDVGPVDVVCGGFPCQPWSNAGKQGGTEDDRDLWPAMLRVIADIRPRWVIGENVGGFVSNPLGLDRSLSDLEAEGYSVRAFVIPACAVGAPHRRDRCWIVAHNDSGKRQRERPSFMGLDAGANGWDDIGGLQHWFPEPDVGRVAHGVPKRVDRLGALGNAVVPQVAEYVGRLIDPRS